MSFKTALASCWDICKYNCTNSRNYFNLTKQAWLPQFYLTLYESYGGNFSNLEYPYTEKPRRDCPIIQKGIVETDDKLVSSFLGWIFTIPEMLVWTTVAVGMMLASVLAFLGLVSTFVTIAVASPIFLLLNEREILYYQCPKLLKNLSNTLSHLALFAVSALLRVPYHLLKAILRIPAGVVVAVQAIVSPSPAPILQPSFAYRRPLYEQFIRNEDLETAIDLSFNESLPSSASDPIQGRELRTNWCEDQLDKLGFTDPPGRYTCVISGALMNPPFLVGDGYLYDEDSIETHFDNADRNRVPRKSPLTNESISYTHQAGVALEAVKNEIVSFIIAVRANYHVDKIQGKEEKNSGTKTVLKVAEDIQKKANMLHEKINKYVKKRHAIDHIALATEMINDKAFMTGNDEAMLSTTVIAKAWSYIKELTGALDDPDFLTMSPTNAIVHFFRMIKEKDASFNNLIINVLREAMLEEQKVSKEYEATWISQPGRGIAALNDELSARLKQYLSEEKPQSLDGVVEKLQKDKAISDKALQYALLLIKDPEKAVNFDQFEPEKKERLATINAFLEAFYAPETVLLMPVFLMTLKEIILKEGVALKQSSNFSGEAYFGSVLQQSVSEENENRDLEVVEKVSFEKGM